MRLQGMASAIRDAVNGAKNPYELANLDAQLGAVIAEVANLLEGDISDEFNRVMATPDAPPAARFRARSAALDGWLRGAVAAATYEHKLEVELRPTLRSA
jgi:hypothetical protein